MSAVPVVIAGLGPVGRLCAKFALRRPDLNMAAAVDINPEYSGRDLGEVLEVGRLGVTIEARLEQALARAEKGVVILCTGSYLESVAPQIMTCLQAGWRVVSTCEQLAYPFKSAPQASAQIDEAARKAGLAVLGTGVNPGFTMDALPALLTSVTSRVDSILVERFQDASLRRLPFQQKIGAGLTLAEFEDQVAEGRIRHVGFAESAELLAAALGVELEKIEERVWPVMAARELRSQFMEIKPGLVCGVNQVCQGFSRGRAVITLNLQAYFGHPDPKDRVFIQGEPSIESLIKGGVAGDSATCAITINAVPRLFQARPGLRTMLDVGLTSGRLW
ncbi:MAG: dihydrodipicolinate reductase [Thermodesulfobacteriota bacterium]